MICLYEVNKYACECASAQQRVTMNAPGLAAELLGLRSTREGFFLSVHVACPTRGQEHSRVLAGLEQAEHRPPEREE